MGFALDPRGSRGDVLGRFRMLLLTFSALFGPPGSSGGLSLQGCPGDRGGGNSGRFLKFLGVSDPLRAPGGPPDASGDL